LLNIK